MIKTATDIDTKELIKGIKAALRTKPTAKEQHRHGFGVCIALDGKNSAVVGVKGTWLAKYGISADGEAFDVCLCHDEAKRLANSLIAQNNHNLTIELGQGVAKFRDHNGTCFMQCLTKDSLAPWRTVVGERPTHLNKGLPITCLQVSILKEVSAAFNDCKDKGDRPEINIFWGGDENHTMVWFRNHKLECVAAPFVSAMLRKARKAGELDFDA